jgi:hypothetical protein
MPIEANMVLAISAKLDDGGVTLDGGGWAVRPPQPMPCAIVVLLAVPRAQAGAHRVRLELLYATGEPVMFPSPEGLRALIYEDEVGASGLDDPTLTTPLTTGIIIKVGPMALPEGREYLWRLQVDGQTRDHWQLAFRTTPPLPGE